MLGSARAQQPQSQEYSSQAGQSSSVSTDTLQHMLLVDCSWHAGYFEMQIDRTTYQKLVLQEVTAWLVVAAVMGTHEMTGFKLPRCSAALTICDE